jgi:hypothetical protein
MKSQKIVLKNFLRNLLLIGYEREMITNDDLDGFEDASFKAVLI